MQTIMRSSACSDVDHIVELCVAAFLNMLHSMCWCSCCYYGHVHCISGKNTAPRLDFQLTETNCAHFFTALHVMQTRYSEENSVRLSVRLSVRPSVRLSVTRVIPDKTEERSVQIFIPYERIFILVFWEEEWLVGGDPFYLKFWVNRPPLERNRRFSTNNSS